MPRKIVFTMVLYLINPQVSLGKKVCVCIGGGKKRLGERRLRLTLTGVHISPFDSYKCSKYHLPMILGSEFEVQSFSTVYIHYMHLGVHIHSFFYKNV